MTRDVAMEVSTQAAPSATGPRSQIGTPLAPVLDPDRGGPSPKGLEAGDAYRTFLEAKAVAAPVHGFEVDPGEVNPELKDFVRAIVVWAAAGGRRGIFSSFGLHKTSTMLELARLALKHRHAVPLITLPLGVRQEFFEEAETRFRGDHAVKLRFIRRTSEADESSINLTNYENVRDGRVDPRQFGFAGLDEAAVLRAFGGNKTFREFMALFAGDDRTGQGRSGPGVGLRFVATATPDPNEFIELLAYAAFLGIMDVGQAKTRFFQRDSEHANRLTLYPHKVDEFWLWVSTWAVFLSRPSDLGFSDEGYVLPELDVRWHEVPSDHGAAGTERDGQGRMFADAALGVVDASREKRRSLGARVAKMHELRAEAPQAHRIIWHDLEDERRAIEAAVPDVRSIHGGRRLEENEEIALAFKHGRLRELATKPVMSGAGCNFQMHCHWAIFLGIGHKFHDFIQAVHRLARFGQTHRVRLDLIHTEAERGIRRSLERRWAQHDEQAARMREIIARYGLGGAHAAHELRRSIGVERKEASGETWCVVNNDCVDECRAMESCSVDLIVTSIPFSTQYEYTPSYNDFGHTDDDVHFWRQMDFLTPELLRVLKPGRLAAVHVKDRVVPGGINGLGFRTIAPFSDDCVAHYRRHGFAFMARRTVVTDVVRENSGTYRLGWTEQCKDATTMGAGLPEYVLLFRKAPSDRANGYADTPVLKLKKEWDRREGRWSNEADYSRGRWQLDAHGFWRSSGDRPLSPEDLVGLPAKAIYKLFREHSRTAPYSFAHHVACAELLEQAGQLPPTFMLLPPQSAHPDVDTTVTRMRTLNTRQAAAGREKHLCPLQFDIVERLIEQASQPGETVLDPFCGIGTVPYCAIRAGRRGLGVELGELYWRDAAAYCQAAEDGLEGPGLFDLMDAEAAGE